MPERYEAIVVGSGFGGAINACRLSKKWPGKVLVLERGKRYPMGSFPRSPHDMARNFWNLPSEARRRPKGVESKNEQLGMFDIHSFGHMDAVVCAGYGGGSLIYANVFLEPPDAVFDDRWPDSCKKPHLAPYYNVAKQVLGSRPIPRTDDPRRRIVRTELFEQVAQKVGRKSRLLDLNVFFGNNFQEPLDIGVQAENRFGALQTSCVYCAECDVGCNYHAKNTLDLNYLHVAEKHHKAEIRTEHLVQRIVPLDAEGRDDPNGDGASGYKVYFRDLTDPGGGESEATTNRVVVSAGTLGSVEMLLRAKHVHKTLPNLSAALGEQFSGNGDFLSFVAGSAPPANPNYGPVITQYTDFNLFEDFEPEHAFIMEDASYPVFAAWFAEGIKPGFMRIGNYWRAFVSVIRRIKSGGRYRRIGYALREMLEGDISQHTSVLLCMGLDKSDGVLKLGENGWIDVDWPYRKNLPLYKHILAAGKAFKSAAEAKLFVPLPTWLWPLRRNVTVHALGGCVLADSAATGVVSADLNTFGQAFGYTGLYVADGSILPTAVGANPTATISALSEMVAESITGNAPDANL